MKKAVVFVIHAGFWLAYLSLLVIIVAAVTNGFSTDIPPKYIAKVGFSFAVLPSFITFYLFYYNLFPKYIKTQKKLLAFVYGVLFSISSALVGGLVLSLLFDSNSMFKDSFVSFFSEIILMTLFAVFAGVMSILIKGFITWYDEIKLKEELIEKNHQIELALVKSQLDPHFLFNTINNIDALILKDPEVASEYLNKLSDILRFMLYETKTEKIALSKELEYIEKYIALQKTRTSNENFVHFNLSGKMSNKMISPMILIPFIENAFKHTSNKKNENAITISLAIEENRIVFDCQNKYDENKLQVNANGLGNTLIRKRVELMYPGKHQLSITKQDACYTVKLILSND
ncbi:MAG TPA: histidine kinase [Flavobacteriales bacterium]|nr:histidine kinase [Flavobacteriales bacterium]